MACCLLFCISRHQDNATAGTRVALIKLRQNCTFNIMHIIRKALICATPEALHFYSEPLSFKSTVWVINLKNAVLYLPSSVTLPQLHSWHWESYRFFICSWQLPIVSIDGSLLTHTWSNHSLSMDLRFYWEITKKENKLYWDWSCGGIVQCVCTHTTPHTLFPCGF